MVPTVTRMTEITELAMPAPPASQGAGPRDFSRKRKLIHFTVDDDVFEAAPAIPADLLVEFAVRYEQATGVDSLQETADMLTGVLELVLLPDSYTLLRARLKDRARPVELDQLDEIIQYLMGEYGLRPTQVSPSSSDGPPTPESGTSSTESTPAEASTSSPSLPTGS